MLRSRRFAAVAAGAILAAVAGHAHAVLDVDNPTSNDSFANNVNISADGNKGSGHVASAYLRKWNGSMWVTVTNAHVDVTPGTQWSATFSPNPTWTNGDYEGYVTSGSNNDQGDTFTVVNPP